MIIVHHLDDSRSQRILWLQEELGLPYEIRQHKRDPKSRLAPPELKRIHPLGKSPVIEDDGHVVAESGAIIEYILRKFGNGRLQPLQMTRVTTIMSIGCTTLRVPECLP
jgi:glutathione S-transferase